MKEFFRRGWFNPPLESKPEKIEQNTITFQLPLTMEDDSNEFQTDADSQQVKKVTILDVLNLIEKIEGAKIHPESIGSGKGIHKIIELPKNEKSHTIFTEAGYNFLIIEGEKQIIMFGEIHPFLGADTAILDNDSKFFQEHLNAHISKLKNPK